MHQIIRHTLHASLGFVCLGFAVAAAAAPKAKALAKASPTPEAVKSNPKAVKSNPKAVKIKMTTSMGVIRVELDPDKAPITVKNFVDYVKSGHYNGTIFHRVMSNFMIQGGGFDPKMKEKSTKSAIKNEAKNGLLNLRGTIAMARTNDPESATAQFFINLKDNSFLDAAADNPGYAVFGKVTDGMKVVDSIGGVDGTPGVKTGQFGMYSDVPVKPVVIEAVTVEK